MGETILCPYYQTKNWRTKGNNITITCKKIPNEEIGVKNMLSFRTLEDRKKWMAKFCRCWEFKTCPYYNMEVQNGKYNKA